MANKISDLIKILAGRKLSQKKMGLARGFGRGVSYYEKDKFYWELFFRDGKFLEKTIKYSLQTTQDFSFGTKKLHMGYYRTFDSERIYNEEGFLEQENIIKKDGPTLDYLTMEYSPAGSFFGTVMEIPSKFSESWDKCNGERVSNSIILP